MRSPRFSYGRGRGTQDEDRGQSRKRIQCYYCKRYKYNHIEVKCRDKEHDEKEQGKEQNNFAQNVEGGESKLF